MFQSKKKTLSLSLCPSLARRGTLKPPHTRSEMRGSRPLRAKSSPACSSWLETQGPACLCSGGVEEDNLPFVSLRPWWGAPSGIRQMLSFVFCGWIPTPRPVAKEGGFPWRFVFVTISSSARRLPSTRLGYVGDPPAQEYWGHRTPGDSPV